MPIKIKFLKLYYLFQVIVLLFLSYFSLPHQNWEKETWFDQANNYLRDLKFLFRGPTQPSGDVVFVAIGEHSISQIGEWPWKRRYQAALIDSIFKKGAKNLGLDIVWPERDASESYDNQILKAVLEKYSDRITFAWISQCLDSDCFAEDDSFRVIRNDTFFQNIIKSSGFVNASKSARGKIDKAIFWFQDKNQKYPSMPLATAARRLNQDPLSLTKKNWSYLNLSGPAGTLPRIEASCLFDQGARECDLKEDALRGKTVILGVTALGVGDQVATAFDKVVDGLEIQADLTDQILHRRIPRQWPWLAWIGFIILSGILLLFTDFLKNLQLLFSFAIIFLIVFFVDIWFFSQNIFLASAIFYANAIFLGTSSFSFRFYQEFRQKQFLKSAFSRYLSPQVVKILMKNPEVLRLGGQKREITILFCDLRNFTGISEKLSPEMLTALLNEILTLLTEVIFKFGGTVDKYIGDALMAFFNAPLNQPDHAFLACAAAKEMAQRMLEMKDSFQSRYGVEINIGIGINTGEAHVGNLGSEQRFNYSVLGDAVNIAARVESATKETGVTILTTQATLNAIEKLQMKLPRQRSVGKVTLKGKAEPLELFEVMELS